MTSVDLETLSIGFSSTYIGFYIFEVGFWELLDHGFHFYPWLSFFPVVLKPRNNAHQPL